jgi:hypothetical protein
VFIQKIANVKGETNLVDGALLFMHAIVNITWRFLKSTKNNGPRNVQKNYGKSIKSFGKIKKQSPFQKDQRKNTLEKETLPPRVCWIVEFNGVIWYLPGPCGSLLFPMHGPQYRHS